MFLRGGAGFGSLSLDFSEQKKSLEPWVYTFEEVLWDKRLLLGQQASEFQTMVLDFRLALAFTLIAFYIISSKLINALSCCSILTLMEGLRLFWK